MIINNYKPKAYFIIKPQKEILMKTYWQPMTDEDVDWVSFPKKTEKQNV